MYARTRLRLLLNNLFIELFLSLQFSLPSIHRVKVIHNANNFDVLHLSAQSHIILCEAIAMINLSKE